MAQAAATLTPNSYVTGLLRDASIEVSARDASAAERLRDWFAPGALIFINYLPGADLRRTVDTAAALSRAGFAPVPHVAARGFASAGQLSEYLSRLTGEAGATAVLAIGGDVAVSRGPFASALDMLETGAFAERGIERVGFGGYPEDHPALAPETLRAALVAKVAVARKQGLNSFVVTQFGFEAAPVLASLKSMRADGIACPVRIGIAGPASIRTLLTFAMKCGVGASLRVLLNQPQSIGRLLRDASPDELVAELAEGLRAMHAAGTGLHLFPFGGLVKTAAWRRQVMN